MDDEKKPEWKLIGAIDHALSFSSFDPSTLFPFTDPVFIGDPWECWRMETQWKTDAMCRN